MVRIADAADASLAAILARNRFGIATAAIIRMIATTISNSMSENPPFRFIRPFFSPHVHNQVVHFLGQLGCLHMTREGQYEARKSATCGTFLHPGNDPAADRQNLSL